jgi:hypothetical protein
VRRVRERARRRSFCLLRRFGSAMRFKSLRSRIGRHGTVGHSGSSGAVRPNPSPIIFGSLPASE